MTGDCQDRAHALHAEHGVGYVAAPIFGRPDAAARRELWVMTSGDAAAKARVRPLLDDLGARGVFDFGDDPGAATAVKLAGNFMIINAARSFAEAFDAVGAEGVDRAAFLEMITKTLLPGSIYEGHGRRLLAGAPPMRGGIPEKDVGFFVSEAAAHGVATPIAERLHGLVKA